MNENLLDTLSKKKVEKNTPETCLNRRLKSRCYHPPPLICLGKRKYYWMTRCLSRCRKSLSIQFNDTCVVSWNIFSNHIYRWVIRNLNIIGLFILNNIPVMFSHEVWLKYARRIVTWICHIITFFLLIVRTWNFLSM